jgi:hypothetical protein
MTIINNGLVAEEVGNLISNPIFYVPDPINAGPVAGAQMYFGTVNTDPELVENQKNVYSLQEDRASIQMQQPIICSAGGVPQLNGATVSLAIVGSYSLKILDADGQQVYYFPFVDQANNQGYSSVIAEESKDVAVGILEITFDVIEATTASFYRSQGNDPAFFNGLYMKKDIDYTVDSPTTITLSNALAYNYVILGREMDPTGQIVPVVAGSSNLFVYQIQPDAVASDLQIGDTVTINGLAFAGDGLGGGKFVTVAGATGTPDGVNYIDLNNGNQLQSISNRENLKTYSEDTHTLIFSDPSVLAIDLQNGAAQRLTLTKNATSINFIGLNPNTDRTTTLSLKIVQGGAGSYTVAWPAIIKWANGNVPTVTPALGSIDRYVFVTDDGGVTWHGMTAGQDFT